MRVFLPARSPNSPPLSKHAPHPSAARQFVDYLLSQDGQRRLGKAGLFPIRRESGPRNAREAEAVTPIRIDRNFGELLDQRRRVELLRRWQAAVAGHTTSVATTITGELP